ncbi:hypothetical protein T11_3720, partial [Trichinella zimbabwensis]
LAEQLGITVIMADTLELCLVANNCFGMSCEFERRAFKFQYSGIPVKCRGCSKDKQGCEGAISTNLDSHAYTQALFMETCLWITTWHTRCNKFHRKAEGGTTKSIPENYNEEITAPSAVPSPSVQFPVFRQVNNVQHVHWVKRCFRLLVNYFDQETAA